MSLFLQTHIFSTSYTIFIVHFCISFTINIFIHKKVMPLQHHLLIHNLFTKALPAFPLRQADYISPNPLLIAWDRVSIAAASSSPSQIRLISVPVLIPAAITLRTLLAAIFFSPHSMITSHLNFMAVWERTPAGNAARMNLQLSTFY